MSGLFLYQNFIRLVETVVHKVDRCGLVKLKSVTFRWGGDYRYIPRSSQPIFKEEMLSSSERSSRNSSRSRMSKWIIENGWRFEWKPYI